MLPSFRIRSRLITFRRRGRAPLRTCTPRATRRWVREEVCRCYTSLCPIAYRRKDFLAQPLETTSTIHGHIAKAANASYSIGSSTLIGLTRTDVARLPSSSSECPITAYAIENNAKGLQLIGHNARRPHSAVCHSAPSPAVSAHLHSIDAIITRLTSFPSRSTLLHRRRQS